MKILWDGYSLGQAMPWSGVAGRQAAEVTSVLRSRGVMLFPGFLLCPQTLWAPTSCLSQAVPMTGPVQAAVFCTTGSYKAKRIAKVSNQMVDRTVTKGNSVGWLQVSIPRFLLYK